MAAAGAALLVLFVVVALPADRPPSPALGRLGSLLTLVPADAASRTETLVSVDARPIGDVQVRPPRDEASSVEGIADVRVLADAFDALNVQAAAFTTDVFRFAHDGGALLQYRALATGTTPTFLVIGLTMSSAADARANADRLRALVDHGISEAARRPWSELVGVSSITTVGRVVVAVLSTKVPTLWLSLERDPDSLVWWSQ